jgi:hypothetical protein
MIMRRYFPPPVQSLSISVKTVRQKTWDIRNNLPVTNSAIMGGTTIISRVPRVPRTINAAIALRGVPDFGGAGATHASPSIGGSGGTEADGAVVVAT